MYRLICLLGKIRFLFKSKKKSENIKKILIIRSGSIGDVLMTTPLIRAIRKKYPKAKISYLVGEWSKEVLKDNKNIDQIITFKDEIVFKKKFFEILKLIRQIRSKKFDICFVLDKHFLWTLFAFFCNIQFRIGFDRFGEGFANNLNIKYDGTKYELDYYLNIAKLLNVNIKNKKMEMFLTEKDKKFVYNFIKKNKLKNIIGIAAGGAENPGQRMFIKRWPKENYISLIDKLIDKHNILLLGGKNDYQLNESIKNEILRKNEKIKNKLINLAGKTTIKQSVALIDKCKYFITHDSGPMHIATLTKTRLITLFGPTPAERFAPKNAIVIKSKLDCCPCYDVYGGYKKCGKECMESIEVKEVLKKIK
jgi:heptosyltransferase-2